MPWHFSAGGQVALGLIVADFVGFGGIAFAAVADQKVKMMNFVVERLVCWEWWEAGETGEFDSVRAPLFWHVSGNLAAAMLATAQELRGEIAAPLLPQRGKWILVLQWLLWLLWLD